MIKILIMLGFLAIETVKLIGMIKLWKMVFGKDKDQEDVL